MLMLRLPKTISPLTLKPRSVKLTSTTLSLMTHPPITPPSVSIYTTSFTAITAGTTKLDGLRLLMLAFSSFGQRTSHNRSS
jgi:hypothetical protein